jgi:regulator of replication initiation timing
MSTATDDALLQFFSEDFGGPSQVIPSMSVFNLEGPAETPTSPLSWESITPPSSPEAYFAENPQPVDSMDLVPNSTSESLDFFDSSSSSINSPPPIAQTDSSSVSQIFANPSLTKEQVNAIAAAMSSSPPVYVKPDPADAEVAQHPAFIPVDSFADDFANGLHSADDFSGLEHSMEEDLEDLIDAAKAKRSRKKRKISPTESIDVLPDDIENLDQKILLQLSSRAFEEYVRRKTAVRDLTSEEKKDLKRQRRLIKNRESAQASRQRKKNYIEKLEAKVASLQQNNTQLRAQVAALTGDNTKLNQEVANLQGLIKKTPALQQLWTSGINYVASLAKQQKEESQQAPASTQGNNVKAAGVCLLVLLFSFGLFFPNSIANGNNGLPFETAAREPVPEVIPTTTRLFSSKGSSDLVAADANLHRSELCSFSLPPGASSDFTLASSGRTLLSENQFNTKRLEEAYASRVARMPVAAAAAVPEKQSEAAIVAAQVDAVVQNASFPIEQRSVVGDVDAMEVDQQGSQHVQVNAVNHDGTLNATQVPSLAQPSMEQVSVESEASIVAAAAAQVINFKPNVTYLMCNNVQQITPVINTDMKEDPNAPTLISFLIPPDSLDSSHKSSGRSSVQKELLEVTCKVVGVNLVPMNGAAAAASSAAIDVSA